MKKDLCLTLTHDDSLISSEFRDLLSHLKRLEIMENASSSVIWIRGRKKGGGSFHMQRCVSEPLVGQGQSPKRLMDVVTSLCALVQSKCHGGITGLNVSFINNSGIEIADVSGV